MKFLANLALFLSMCSAAFGQQGGTGPGAYPFYIPFTAPSAGVFTDTQFNGPYFASATNGCNFQVDFQSDFGHSTHNATDALGGCVAVPGGSTVYEAHGLFADVNTLSNTTAAVGVRSQAICGVTGCRIWGLNSVATDGGFVPGFYYGYEDNINVGNAGTSGFGIAMIGVWTAQPTVNSSAGNFPGVIVQAPLLANLSGPSGNQWTAAFVSANGASNRALDVGTSNISGNPNSSQQIMFHSRNGSGTQINGAIVGTPDVRSNQAIVPAQATDYGAQRIYANYFSTAYSGADSAIVLTGWGTGAAVSAAAGFDQSVTFTVTAGTTPSTNPTFVITFKDGQWGIGAAAAPGFICGMTAGTGTFAFIGVTTTSTALTGTYEGIPINASTYIITCNGVGR